MRMIAALIVAAMAASSANAGVQTRAAIVSVAEAPRNCPLTVSFGSYAMGIDGRTFDKVTALLSRDRRVTKIEQHRWGREGEVTLCARTRSRADAQRLFGAIRRLLPAKPRGPVTVTTDRASFTAPRGTRG